jgi:putative MATE family efflux protein
MENKKKKNPISRNFTEGKITGPLIRFAVPVLLALFLQAMYGAADLLIVGQFGTSADVSGVSTGSQILMTLTNLISSFAMGTTILLGQQIGEGKTEKGGETIGASICLYFFIGIAVTLLTVFGAPALASLMNAPAEARQQTISYIRICGGGTLVIIAYNLIGSIFRGIGDSRTPLITVAIACAANVFGDLLLVAVFHMGTAGAAAATVAAQALSVVISFGIIRKQTLPFAFRRKQIRPVRDLFRRITALGLPIALQDFLVGISFLVILAIVNALGLVASAGVGVAEKVCAFIMLLPSAFMQAMSAFVAQNAGAGKYDRALRALRSAIVLSLTMGILMFYLAFFHGPLLAGIFSRDPQVIAAAADYLKAYAIDCLLTAFLFCFIGFYNGVGMTKFVMIQGILGAFCIRVPVSWLMSRQVPPSLFHIGLATPCSTSVQIVLCLIAMAWTRKHIIAKH